MGKKKQTCSHSEFPILDNLGSYASATKGDGNCLFRASSDQIFGDENKHSEIRYAVVSYVKDHAERFAPFVGEFGETFDLYISRLFNDGVYGGHIEIVGFAEVYAKQVVIYQSDNLYMVRPEGHLASELKGQVHVAYHSWEHYSSVRKIGGPSTGPVEIDILQNGDLSGIPTSGAVENESSEIPAWKIDIVMKSVPDADEKKVSELLKMKDYELVIEELIMAEYDDPIAGNSVSNDSLHGDAHNGSQDDENIRQPTISGGGKMLASKDAGIHNQPILTAKDRKLAAKQRRQEKKERVRTKKQKPKIYKDDDSNHPSHLDESDTKVDIKIVHI